MATRFTVVARKDMSKGAGDNAKLYYAQAQSNGESDFQSLCRTISSSSTASEGDVEVVVTGLADAAEQALSRGEIVDLGKLGRLRVSLSSTGSATEDECTAAKIRKARIVFTPGERLRNAVGKMKYERVSAIKPAGTSEEGQG